MVNRGLSKTTNFQENPIPDLHITFTITDGSYEEKEQYLLYGLDSFIADIGGYLGLLLGWSLFSLYNEVVDLVVRLFKITIK